MKKYKDKAKLLFLFPPIVYSIILILLPILYVFLISFFKSDSYGGMLRAFTLSNYVEIFNIIYLKIFFKSALIGFITTVVCLIISYPFAIALMSKKETTRNYLIKLVMVPFLMNSLIRTYAWIVLLRKNGIINSGLISLGFINKPLTLMYNNFGIIIGMIYTLLPFMILPIYSAVSKVDRSVVEASFDLGASKIQTFMKVYLPLTISGAFNGSLMVFIPAIGYFFIADILGGGKEMIIGNLIKNQFLTARNWPFGAALSIFLVVITFILVKVYKKLGGKMDDLGGA